MPETGGSIYLSYIIYVEFCTLAKGIQVACRNPYELNSNLRRWIMWYYEEKNDLIVAAKKGDTEKNREFLATVEKDRTYLLRLPIIEIRHALINNGIYSGERDMRSSETGIQSNNVRALKEDNESYLAATYVRFAQLIYDIDKEVVFVPLPIETYPPAEAVVTAYYESTADSKTKNYRVDCVVTGFDLIPA